MPSLRYLHNTDILELSDEEIDLLFSMSPECVEFRLSNRSSMEERIRRVLNIRFSTEYQIAVFDLLATDGWEYRYAWEAALSRQLYYHRRAVRFFEIGVTDAIHWRQSDKCERSIKDDM